jgi:CRISPR-associated endonuclease Csn1
VWHVLFSFDDTDKLKEFALNKLHLSEENAVEFSKIRLQQGYATISLSAIKKILPYLKKGILYSHAVYLANLSKVFGESKISNELVDSFIKLIEEIKKENEIEKSLNIVVNELIKSQLNSEFRYRIEDNRELDNSEKTLIEQKLIEIVGLRDWNKKVESEKLFAKNYCETYFKEFLKKPFNGKKDELFLTVPSFYERIFNHLKETYGIDESRKKYLWHPSEQETYPNAKEVEVGVGFTVKQLGNPQPISNGFKNPMALKTMHKLKQLINYLLVVGKIDEDTKIVVEIARELNDANKRKAIEKWQRDREKENESFKKRIDEINSSCNTNYNREDKTLLNKVRLWEEQNQQCLYTGKTIGLSDLFNGNKFDFEHTIPASMSFDNELKNLTIADSAYNREIKMKQIPFDLPNYENDALGYTAIKPRLQFLFDKVDDLEKLHDDWKFKTKFASTKEIKDATIQRRHLIKMDLDYWRKKLDTFTCEEYKAVWRNSQLRDTQIITKYALPYLKTIFKRAEVQKGSTTATFREIYQIQPRLEKKDRSKHSHHAIDAAVLTLIPAAPIRDKILLAYNEQRDNHTGIVYHEKPRFWKDFNAGHILSIEDDVLINNQSQNKQLTHTKKNIRKRGKQQFVKVKDANGKWHYKLDENGLKIPLIADGDSIRGQLHKESFFGAIKLGGDLTLVERYPISTFTSINDCKHIVDKKVREIVTETLEQRMANGESFDNAKLEPISFPSGKAVIKKVRCKVAAGRGYLTPEKALVINTHDFINKKKNHDYKHVMYAQNEENTLCLYYEKQNGTNTERAFKIIGLFELSKLNLNSFGAIKNEPFYNSIEIGKGEKKQTIPLNHILTVGTKVIFYKEHIEELYDLNSSKELLRRIFRVYKFNEPAPSTVYIYFQNHLEARSNDTLGNGDKEVVFDQYQSRIFLNASKFKCAIEDKHFEIMPDGEIIWLKHD